MTAELRIAVVGIGQRASLAMHVPTVMAAADPDPRGQERARDLFGPEVQVKRDYRDLLELDLDGVILTTPDDLHAGPAIDFLKAGVAVLVEKPLAITTEDCDEVLETAMATGTRLYVGHNLRHAAAIRALRDVVRAGDIGSVKAVWCRHFVGHGGDFYFRDWHAERSRGTGLLLQKGAHDIDVIHWLADGACREVVAYGGLEVYGHNPRREPGAPWPALMGDWYDPGVWPPSALHDLNPVVDVEDVSMMLGRLDNGVFISYQQCHFTPDYWRNYTVIGDEGRCENFGDLDGAAIKVWNKRRSGYREDADKTIAIQAGTSGHGGADAGLVMEWLRFVAEGGPTETSPLAAREAVAAGVAATNSIRTGGRPVTVSAPRPELAAYFTAHQVK